MNADDIKLNLPPPDGRMLAQGQKGGHFIYTEEKVIAAILADRQQRGEPVAWGQLGMLNGRTYMRMNYDRTPYPPPPDVAKNLNLVPLYTAPPRQPLTIGQINGLPEAGGWWPMGMNDRIMRLIRAVERAHGIESKGAKHG